MNDIFGKDGALKNFLNNFEYRHEQLQMSEFILENLFDQKNTLVEAGTGIGKTLAYLIPTIIYCLENNKTLAVSTETKALQKQLIDKDLPLVKNILKKYFGKDIKYSLCLGSSNYPCRKRFEALLSKGKFSKSEMKTAERLSGFFNNKDIFTRLDIKVSGKMWSEIAREPDACNYYNCPFASLCVFQKAKREWINSKVLVMNHYLFFSNIASGKAYLPKFDIAIFDEAHSIEEIASDQLGFNISYDQIMDIINKLHSPKRKTSILLKIANELKRNKALKIIGEVSSELGSFFENLRKLFPASQNTIRLRGSLNFGQDLMKSTKDLLLILESVEDEFEEEPWKIEFDIVRGKLFVFLMNLEALLYQQNPNFVYWIERSEEELLGDIHLMGEPLDVSEIMHNEVNSFYRSNIFVSATLTSGGDFSFLANRLGIHDYKSLLLDSPFDYKNQVVLYLGKDAVPPDNPSYVDQATKISAEIIDHIGGNCLILFTSYRMLGSVKEGLAGIADYNIYAQGDYPASETVERYIKDNGSVLMGTHSFWQGIDLPGDLLKGVILMRLPFGVPDRPLIQARIESLQEMGMNPFFSYQIPNAVIRFKQGFGRLIRSSTDKGIVAVLDSRILSKSYGKLFIKALPGCTVVQRMDELKAAYSAIEDSLSRVN
ncbi:MAG: ATP-dependent DNA helicase [bacterium]|nr:ATP-dependent DNA helicase [bacterium]